MSSPQISLEQWRALIAVVDSGGYAQAALAMNKSQSAVTYAVQKIEEMLGIRVFDIMGRKAVLTEVGQMLYRRARALVEEADGLERAARTLSAGWEAEISLAVEILFPNWLLFQCLSRFGAESPNTRIEIIESVIGGTSEALLQGRANLAIAPITPPGFLGERLISLRLMAVASPNHPLQQLNRPLTLRDLNQHRHILVRDSGSVRDSRVSTVNIEQRWTVSHIASSIEAVVMGAGFTWLPEYRIERELSAGLLKPLDLREGGDRWLTLYLILADPECAGPGVRRLAAILKESTFTECERRRGAGANDA
jgi:DNA-binding transcriptional LysR family regulator